MYVKILGPDAGAESEHKIDGASAVFLYDQLWRHGGDRKVMIDTEWYLVERAQVQFYTAGPEINSILTMNVSKTSAPDVQGV